MWSEPFRIEYPATGVMQVGEVDCTGSRGINKYWFYWTPLLLKDVGLGSASATEWQK
jgi:hypothetical protein